MMDFFENPMKAMGSLPGKILYTISREFKDTLEFIYVPYLRNGDHVNSYQTRAM